MHISATASLIGTNKKKEAQTGFSVSLGQQRQRASLRQPWQVQPWAFYNDDPRALWDLNNQTLDFVFCMISTEGQTESLATDCPNAILEKTPNSTPKNCVWTSVAADSHSSPLALDHAGLRAHKGGDGTVFMLGLFLYRSPFR